MRKLRTLLPLALCLGLLAGCHKSGKPSPDYQKARTLWLDLLRDKMGKAYSDPSAVEVMELLDRVDPRSMDAVVAKDLKAEIQKGRAEALASDEAVRVQVAQAQNAVQNPVFTGTGGGYRFAVAEGDGGTGLTYDAGPGPAEQPKIGMSAEEFERKFGRCFESRQEAAVAGQLGGRIWGMRDLIVCRELYSGLVDAGIVIFEGKVINILPLSQLSPQKYKLVDGKLVPMDEADKAKLAAQAAATTTPPPTATPEPTPTPGRPPIQTTGPGASVAQPIAPAADPSLNPKSSLSGSQKP